MNSTSQATNLTDTNKFGPEVLLVFIGHSSDANEEAKAVRDLEREFQRELERLQAIANWGLHHKTVRFWEWNYDAMPLVGGQEVMITPDLDRADIAVFVFKERIGTVTWTELERSRSRKPLSIPVIAVFSAKPPEQHRFADLTIVENWAELLKKKRSLAEDWTSPDSLSLRPIAEYEGLDHLKAIVFEQLKNALAPIIRPRQTTYASTVIAKSTPFLGDHSHLNYDRRPVQIYTFDELDQQSLSRFLQSPLSRQLLQEIGLSSEVSSAKLSDQLRILGCTCDEHPALGAFLCFAPTHLLTDKFSGCSLQMVIYSGIEKASSKPSITLANGNLLKLFQDGMSWFIKGSGLRRRGSVGSTDRDELEIPEFVLREALANALVHRDYEKPEFRDQPTRLEIFPDRVEITSYGGLMPSVSLEALNKDVDNIAPLRRNPVVAKIFQHMTYVELNASGIARMRAEMERVSLAYPRFIADQHQSILRVVLLRPSTWEAEFEVATTSRKLTGSRAGQKTAFISSTALDLPEHRQGAIDACLRLGVFPIGMEHLPVSAPDTTHTSLKMVDQADIFICILAWHYGYRPEVYETSIVEMEFNRAVERGIPILLYLMHKDHPLTISMVEQDSTAQEKLRKLKERASSGRGRLEFKSPAELRSHIIQSLAALLPTLNTLEEGQAKTFNLHPPNLIPAAPAPYIAHPYSLLQTGQVIGRRDELKLLTDWVTRNEHVPASVRLFNVVAIGGMGKSALTWKWFNEIAPNELPQLAGRMWWSFYESDAYFENFVIRALAYTSGMTETDVRALPPHEREDRLFHLLDTQPFLLVLDGLERILLAYARMDAAHLADDDLDERTANDIARYYGLPDAIKETYLEKHRLRMCSDPRAGRFLRRLTQVRASRVLISTRLYPAELQTTTAQPLPGCYALFLTGLSDDDALTLWRAFTGGERSGTSERLLPYFNAFGNYPLLLRALAGEVAEYRLAPGDFDRWLQDHPDFNPAALDFRNARTHVLEYALANLSDVHSHTLLTLAAFRMPAKWETLCAVLVGSRDEKLCPDQGTLVAVMAELEDRGLVGWDKATNRYDLHPIVRGVVWSGVAEKARRGIYTSLHTHFESAPKVNNWREVSRLEDLAPTIELYHTLIGLERYDDAGRLFSEHLDKATFYRLSASQQRIELLGLLFPDGMNQPPRLSQYNRRVNTLYLLALAYHLSGFPKRAIPLYRKLKEERNNILLNDELCSLSDALRLIGQMYESTRAICNALHIARVEGNRFDESYVLRRLGATLAARGIETEATIALHRSLRILEIEKPSAALSIIAASGVVNAHLAQRMLWSGDFDNAQKFSDTAWAKANDMKFERDFVRAARLQGTTALGLQDFTVTEERLHHALIRARAVNYVEEELPALIALAELRRQQSKPDEARELLDAVWDSAERGPYPLFHADALNVLAQLERDAGNTDKAIAAATAAYRHAWCDGPPYAYHWGLVAARRHLQELGAPEPQLPPFDPTQHEPMPKVEINPRDEFYVEVGEDGAGSADVPVRKE